ncbi:MAG: hypothetical protein GXP55_24660 [Deltaproteobacteria bacterium]|nr:hypothetical protein [Deltaproteobacteria bacterium]
MSPRIQKLEALRDRIAQNRRPVPASSALRAVSEPELEIVVEEPAAEAPVAASPVAPHEAATTGRRRPSSPLEIAVVEHSATPKKTPPAAPASTPAAPTPAAAAQASAPAPTPAVPVAAAEEPKTLERPAVQPAAAKAATPTEASPVEVEAAAPAPPSQPIIRVDTAAEVIDTFGEMLDHALALRPR